VAEIGSARAEAVEGTAPGAVAATGFLQRAVLRRRVRFLRRRRELALHDLGGFAFESHRLGEPRDELLGEKLAALDALDDELATLQRALDLREELAVLREPGIASCPECSTIHDSAANFCPSCGRPTSGRGAGAGESSGDGALAGAGSGEQSGEGGGDSERATEASNGAAGAGADAREGGDASSGQAPAPDAAAPAAGAALTLDTAAPAADTPLTPDAAAPGPDAALPTGEPLPAGELE
jgi:hypothetical protein